MENERPKSFEQLIRQSDLPVLVDFWAEWCGACKMMSPTLHEIAKANKGRLLTIKVNVEKQKGVANKYNISGIPTLILFKKGEVAKRWSGALSFQVLQDELNRNL